MDESAARVSSRVRAITTWAGAQLQGAPYLRKWLILGCLLGVIAGLGAVAFYESLALATHLFLTDLAGYQIPTPASEGFLAGSSGFPHPWRIPLIVGLGGLLSGVLVYVLAPEAEGHGTDAAIDTVHSNPRGVRVRAVVVKIVASAITIGSGGSGGREGPTAQISSGFGSYLARAFDLSPADGRIAVAAGIGSGIGSIFSAPLGGALLSAEIVYRDDIEVDALIPSMIASIVGYAVSSAFLGFRPLFGFASAGYRFFDPSRLGFYALIGVLSGFMGLAYATGFYGLAERLERLPIARWMRPAVGGILVGTLAIALPQVIGTGYGWIQKSLGHQLLGLPLWVVLALPFAKILATSLSIGSGGSGGIFGPGIVIGAFTGAAVWRLLAPIAPDVPGGPAPFVIVGMMATFGSICRAPLAVMLMVAEMTGSISALAPAMVAVGIATLIVRHFDATIYRSQLRSRADSPAHRLTHDLPLLGSLAVGDFIAPTRLVLAEHEPVREAIGKLAALRLPGAPVVDERGAFTGVVHVDALERAADDGGHASIGHLSDPTAPTTTDVDRLDSALEALLTARANWIPVLDRDRRVVGILTVSAVVRGYRSGLRAQLRQVSRVAPNTVVVDHEIESGSAAAGKAIHAAGLPPGTIVMTLQREAELIPCRGDTVLSVGDRLGILTHAEHAEEVTRLLRGAAAPPSPSARQSLTADRS
ncbi:MAG TPA: chloride channel protein [Solirubrobacteraceae bacterium]|nr:chloride channel protein [Solirubrobacteraceae bacterium]